MMFMMMFHDDVEIHGSRSRRETNTRGICS